MARFRVHYAQRVLGWQLVTVDVEADSAEAAQQMEVEIPEDQAVLANNFSPEGEWFVEWVDAGDGVPPSAQKAKEDVLAREEKGDSDGEGTVHAR